MRHSEDYERKPAREWTASRTRNTNGTLRETSKLSMRGSRMASIRPNLCAESISPRKTENRKQRPLSIPALEDKIVHWLGDRKSTRLNSSHRCISYAVFCLKKKTNKK